MARPLASTPAELQAYGGADSCYYIGPNRRAMVSLGPVKHRNYCTFSCPFCYVQGPFPRYAADTVPRILSWLTARRSAFDVVYVSGDTDSFAPPRSTEALDLLRSLAELDCDVLFTTRHVFSEEHQRLLASIAALYAQRGSLIIGCVSIAQTNYPRLEPLPIAPWRARFKQLAFFQTIGVRSILTIRPFIPAIPASEYAAIAELGCSVSDVVLGGHWFVDPAGVILERTERALEARMPAAPFETSPLDFTTDPTPWRIYRHAAAEKAVGETCKRLGLPFFMRSDPALDHLRTLRR